MKRGLFTLALLVLIAALVVGMSACTRQKPRPASPQAEVVATETPVEALVTTVPSPPATTIRVTEEATPTLVTGLPTLTPTPAVGEEATPPPPVVSSPTSTPQTTPTAIATAPVPPPTAVSGAEVTYYTVQPGDTLSSIARRFNITVEALMRANDIPNPHSIDVGRELVIPKAGEGPPTPGGGRVHIVQPGENLFRIALRYGVTIEDIVRANDDIVDPRYIYVGQRLTIP